MHYRVFALWLSLILGISIGKVGADEPAPSAESTPNIILIIADDLSVGDLSCEGHPTLKTPNIDRLAKEGLRFTRAFVCASSCSPSRASIITGKYPHNTDAEQLHWALPDDQTTFVERLSDAGYWTAAAGKWHLGDAAKKRFDVVHEADPSGYQLPPDAGRGGKQTIEVAAGGDASGCAEWLPTLAERRPEAPFFLWLASLDPHRDYEDFAKTPTKPEDVVVPPYLPDVPEVRRDLALYYDEILRLDRFVGKLLDELDRQGLARNTLIVFISDNGRPFPRDKTTLYDSGIQTPMLVRWPVRIKPGVCDALVSTVDLAATFIAAARAKPLDGPSQSLLPLFDDPKAAGREMIFAEKNWHDYEARSRCVRDARYKLIRNDYPDSPNTPPADVVRSITYRAMQTLRKNGELPAAAQDCFVTPRPKIELYDTEADPNELKNVAADPHYAEHVSRLLGKLDQWSNETADQLPAARTPDEFHRETGAPLPTRIRPRPPKQKIATRPQ